MNQIITPKSINFKELVKNSNTTLSLSFQTKMTTILNDEFTEEQQQWYVANLFMYMNYHPTNDYPINLEDVFKMIGFANKGNAKRTLENNFTKNEDYKITILPSEKGYIAREDIMLNIDCFKSLCMLAKTSQGKEIRKYYVKLENIYNKIIKEEIKEQKNKLEEKDKLLEEKDKLLLEKDETIKQLEHKPETCGFERLPGYIYFVEDTSKPGHIKLGYATTPNNRVSSLNVGSSTYSLKILATFETFDKEFAEKIIHSSLNPFRIKNRKEWFYFKNQNEMVYALNTVKKCIEFIKNFDINKVKEVKDINLESLLININKVIVEKSNQIKEKHKENSKNTNKKILERIGPKTGIFKGACWVTEKSQWCAQLQHNYKNTFLGYFTDEIDAAKVYNDYASYLNQTENTNFYLNDIPGYITVPRNVPEENKKQINEKKTSEYTGVSYDSKRKYYVAGIGLSGKTYNLGNSQEEVECAKLYNQQALFFNNTFNTKYTLNDIENYTTLPKDFRNKIIQNKINKKSSEFHGVSITTTKKWAASYMLNRKKIHIGTFNTELEACKAYNKVVIQLNENGCNYKINKTSLTLPSNDVIVKGIHKEK